MSKRLLIQTALLSLALAANASAQLVIGDFEDGSQDGFFSWTPANASITTGPVGATLNSSALKYTVNTGTGYHQGLAVRLQEIGVVNDFLNNSFFTTDVTYRAEDFAGAGTYDVLSLVINAPGLGFVDIGAPTIDTGNPGFPGGWDGTNFPGTTTRTMTWDYSSRLSSITPNPSYLELIFIMSSNYTSTVHYFDNVRISGSDQPNWKLNGSGDWNTAGNWANIAVPNAVDAVANLTNVITSNQTIYTNTPVTVGTLNINSPNTYVLAGAGSLTMDVSTGSANIKVDAGSQKINLPLTLNDNTTATIAAGATLTIADPLTLANGSTLTAAGTGTLSIISTVTNAPGRLLVNGPTVNAGMDLNAGTTLQVQAGTVNLNATQHLAAVTASGGTISLASGSKLIRTGSVALTGSAALNLRDGRMIVDYTGSSPRTAVQALVTSGYAGGAWTGNGIRSSNAASNSRLGVGVIEAGSRTSFAGESVDSTTLLVAVSLRGDTNLDFTVNFDDLLSLAQAYGGSGTWANGDSDYNGSVVFDDLLVMAQNYGSSFATDGSILTDSALSARFESDWQLALSIVPEPASATLLALGLLAARRRGR